MSSISDAFSAANWLGRQQSFKAILVSIFGAVVAFYWLSPFATVEFGYVSAIIALTMIVLFHRLNYLHPVVAFVLPWLAIVGLSSLDISIYSTIPNKETYLLILTNIWLAFFFDIIATSTFGLFPKGKSRKKEWKVAAIKKDWFRLFALLFFLLTTVNIAIAGYIPLVKGITEGDTGYLSFGVNGLYGFYCAYANAFALLAFYTYLLTGKRGYLVFFAIVIFTFVLFVTRQNVLSLIVEAIVLYGIVKKPIPLTRIVLLSAVFLVTFSVLGDFRSGDIKVLAGIKSEYQFIPNPFVWLYSYSYFNVLNLDNLINLSQAPYFDGTSVINLIPSFLRPSIVRESYLEVIYFNVSSYLFPVYYDAGYTGTWLLTGGAIFLTVRYYRRIQNSPSFTELGTFAVLYFCALLSFFVNFWFYLPIIFQVAIFRILSLSLRYEKLSPKVLSGQDRFVEGARVT
ncbi:O-antigen polymerase [Gloeobacter violaceus]|uniref:Glr3788 protein n=1 Tax=Gloeobacter violaceus (strain ATCC 29082 / PCC 7421) TaxID=251221 RepID=Q7NEU0_GLOVI|nr:O-antigen polymerase [Gloeobacter violaceus]BAC91729.1 glr3788 [Gloeobacter violaceus PCC 7421]